MPRNAAAYDDDFYAWTQEQARLIRSGSLDAVDLENVAEEIESMGRSDKREIVSRLTVLLAHLLKWQYQSAFRSRSWQQTIFEQRQKVGGLLEESPSLRPAVPDFVSRAYSSAVQEASIETGIAIEQFPPQCPYSTDHIFDIDFLPEA